MMGGKVLMAASPSRPATTDEGMCSARMGATSVRVACPINKRRLKRPNAAVESKTCPELEVVAEDEEEDEEGAITVKVGKQLYYINITTGDDVNLTGDVNLTDDELKRMDELNGWMNLTDDGKERKERERLPYRVHLRLTYCTPTTVHTNYINETPNERSRVRVMGLGLWVRVVWFARLTLGLLR